MSWIDLIQFCYMHAPLSSWELGIFYLNIYIYIPFYKYGEYICLMVTRGIDFSKIPPNGKKTNLIIMSIIRDKVA